jgi:hypothetical protein
MASKKMVLGIDYESWRNQSKAMRNATTPGLDIIDHPDEKLSESMYNDTKDKKVWIVDGKFMFKEVELNEEDARGLFDEKGDYKR